jgi:hypothetical protein
MDARELIRLIRLNIARLRTEGAASVTIASLETLLAAVETHIAQHPNDPLIEVAIENARLEQALEIAVFESRSASALELFKSVIATAKVAIKSLLMINGGAAVALLALIGHLATTLSHGIAIQALAVPLAYFVSGVWFAATFAGLVALSQKLFAENWNRTGNASAGVSIFLGILSLAAFARGSYLAYFAFLTI